MAQMQVWTTVEMTNFNAKMIGLPILCQICVYNAKKAEGAKKKKNHECLAAIFGLSTSTQWISLCIAKNLDVRLWFTNCVHAAVRT